AWGFKAPGAPRMTLAQAITAFLEHLRLERAASPHTLAAYGSDLAKLVAHLEPKGKGHLDVSILDKALLQGFLVRLAGQGLEASSQSRCVACLKSFGNFLSAKTGLPNPARGLRFPKKDQKL